MWQNWARQSLTAFTLVVLVGCNTIPVQNKPMDRFVADGGYRFANIAPGENNSDSLLMILTFSGGGTRAAAFCYGVLEKLRDTEITWDGQQRRLLDEVDIISSVSGGSLPAAYFGLFGDQIFDEFPDKVLYNDIQGSLIKEVLTPLNWPKLVSPLYGRSDMLGDGFSREIFEEKTFADMINRNQRPFVVINATDADLGCRFDFTQRQFDLLYSDLSSYPVGNAVAASASFPGLLAPMTLNNYPKEADYVAPQWLTEELENKNVGTLKYRYALEAETYLKPGRRYVHLCDGGVSDNLGLLPVLQILAGGFPGDVANTPLKSTATKKVVIITVNAKPAIKKSGLDVKDPGLGLFRVLGLATSAPLGNFTDAELALMRSRVSQSARERQLRDRIADLYGEDAVTEHFPELADNHIAYAFVEVDFERIADEAERDYLNDIPTAFKLEREQIDRLRSAAAKVLDTNPEFLSLLEELR
ncbi:MAG: patatin-like phospholipase family protein [Candidatus Hydrogenedentes bacterium]|nr:patatin-like phospholipase family protein [Candidatus Hydrogenedentota bacterium]